MADNVAITAGTGTTIGADEIAAVKYQRIKLIHGADGTNDGDVSTANPLPVVQTGTPGLPTGAATAAKQLADGHNVVVESGTVEATIVNASINGAGAPTIDSYGTKAINLAAGNDQVLVGATEGVAANKQCWVYGIGFTVNVAGTVSFQDQDDAAVSGIMNIDAKSGMVVNPSGNFAMPLWKLGTDKDLEVDIGTSELDGWITYAIVSV